MRAQFLAILLVACESTAIPDDVGTDDLAEPDVADVTALDVLVPPCPTDPPAEGASCAGGYRQCFYALSPYPQCPRRFDCVGGAWSRLDPPCVPDSGQVPDCGLPPYLECLPGASGHACSSDSRTPVCDGMTWSCPDGTLRSDECACFAGRQADGGTLLPGDRCPGFDGGMDGSTGG